MQPMSRFAADVALELCCLATFATLVLVVMW